MEFNTHPALATLGLSELNSGVHDGSWSDAASLQGGEHVVMNPSTGKPICKVALGTAADVERTVAAAHNAYKSFRSKPFPVRGELVRRIGDAMRKFKVRMCGFWCSAHCGPVRMPLFCMGGADSRGAPRPTDGAGRCHLAGDGQDPRRGAGRGAGGDRHV